MIRKAFVNMFSIKEHSDVSTGILSNLRHAIIVSRLNA